ncbi:ABC transporter permease, partial [Rhizobium ruizarguesonis]
MSTVFRRAVSNGRLAAAPLTLLTGTKTLVRFWQIASLVFVIGMWELSSNMQWSDPFFYSSPSGVVQRLYEWATEG